MEWQPRKMLGSSPEIYQLILGLNLTQIGDKGKAPCDKTTTPPKQLKGLNHKGDIDGQLESPSKLSMEKIQEEA